MSVSEDSTHVLSYTLMQLVGLKLCWLYMIAHNAQPSILAGVGTTVVDVGLAVGPGVAWCTSAREGVNTIL